MNFIEVFVKRPVLATVLTIVMILVGAVSWSRLSLRQYPQVDQPKISVTTNYEGAGPDIIEAQVTKPLEQVLAGLEGLDFMVSSSEAEQSKITLNFRLNRDMDGAAADVRDRLQRVRNNLPDGAEDPRIKKTEADATPIIYLAFSSDRHSMSELADYAYRYLESELESITGVASVEIYGGGNYEMHIILDPVKLAAYKITATDIAQALKKQNIKKPAGRLAGKEREYLVTTTAPLNTAKQFNNIVLSEREGAIVRLSDVGHAEVSAEDKRFKVYFNDQPAVSIGIIKQSIANPLEIKTQLDKRMTEISNRLPKGMKIDIANDKTIFIDRSIKQVYQAIWEATLLVIGVILLFLRSFRASIIPLVTIPVSLIGAFSIMYAFGFSINMLTLLALVLAIGLVVDDAIVVLENIFRYIEKGLTPFEAAVKGTKEIGFAVVAMTLTLAAVYTPIALSTGMTGKLFTEFALTLAGAVIISGIVALTLSPMMCAKLLKAHHEGGAIDRAVGSFLDRVDRGYEGLLKKTLHYRKGVMILGLVIAGVGGYLAKYAIPTELAPREDQGVISTRADGPFAASMSYTEKYALEMNRIIAEVPELTQRLTMVQPGGDTYSLNLMLPWEKRKRVCSDITPDLNKKLEQIAGLKVVSYCGGKTLIGGAGGKNFELVLQTSRSYEELERTAQRLMALISRLEGIDQRTLDWDLGAPGQEYIVKIDRDRAGLLGIDAENIGLTLDTLISGRKAGSFDRERKMYPVKVWVGEPFRQSPSDILSMYVRGSKNNKETMVQLSDLVKVETKLSQTQLSHFAGMRAITIKADLQQGYGLGEVLSSAKDIANKVLPDGFVTTEAGETRRFLEEQGSIYLIFGLALAFIFLVMSAQFESFKDPLVIMLSVPLSLTGALITLYLLPAGSLNIYSQIGLVTLIGLITKHGILIVDFANRLREEGMDMVEAVMKASALRLRPILMTTFAMVLGAIPLALGTGAGAEARHQIGWVIVGGMSFGTLFTLFVVPCVYTFISRHRKAS